MLSFECIKNEKSVYFLLTSAAGLVLGSHLHFAAYAAQSFIQLATRCTSQQKVDTFFIFYTLKTEHSTPYIVLVSNSLMSMQVFLH